MVYLRKKGDTIMDNRPICYKIGHGAIIIYGEKIEYYTNYLDNNSSSAESLCIYCKNHGLHIFYFPEKNLFGFIDYCHFQKLKKKYFIQGSFKDLHVKSKTVQ